MALAAPQINEDEYSYDTQTAEHNEASRRATRRGSAAHRAPHATARRSASRATSTRSR
jgi:hypothetical protein